MRHGLAIVLAGIALAGAVYLGSLHLNKHGHYQCNAVNGSGYGSGGVTMCDARTSYWTPDRAVWQIPLAIVIAALGLGAAAAVARPGRGSSRAG